MRVIDTETGQFVEIDPEGLNRDEYGDLQRPVYAMLSHTWDHNGEQTYEELRKIQKRYHPSLEPQTQHGCANIAEIDGDVFPKLVRALPTTLGRLTESEVEALLRLVAETFGLTPAIAPSPSDPSDVPVHAPPPSTSSLQSIWDDPELSPKIREACRVAREEGYRYIWIDSCCIDKSSSSELSEAINSMYKWYNLAKVCYAYLADVPPGENNHPEASTFCKSRWFHRGWTLQELIAPLELEFLSQDWSPIGSKHTLVDLVESVTKIDEKALLHLEPLDAFSVAQRLSWAAERETTRIEDQAYSLLGLFGINMSTLYGEGNHAFRRLQEQIIQRIPDQSLFAWRDIFLPPRNPDHIDTPTPIHFSCDRIFNSYDSFFANDPSRFCNVSNIHTLRHDTSQLPSSSSIDIDYTPTPYGIRTHLQMIPLTQDLLRHALLGYKDIQLKHDSTEGHQWYLAILQCQHVEYPGHLLGRVCYITQPEPNSKAFVYPGFLDGLNDPDLFLLSPETIQRFHQQTRSMTVYIPHPDIVTLPASSHLRLQPYTTIKLLLLRETRDSLRSRGYSADLRYPDPDHQTTHRLTLSNDNHTISVEFQHTLENDGEEFTIEARIKVSGFCVQLDSAPGSDQADCPTVYWSDGTLWETTLHPRTVTFSKTGAQTLIVDLKLDFVGGGYYYIGVDVLSEDLPASLRLDACAGLS